MEKLTFKKRIARFMSPIKTGAGVVQTGVDSVINCFNHDGLSHTFRFGSPVAAFGISWWKKMPQEFGADASVFYNVFMPSFWAGVGGFIIGGVIANYIDKRPVISSRQKLGEKQAKQNQKTESPRKNLGLTITGKSREGP